MTYYEFNVTSRDPEDIVIGFLSGWPFESFMNTSKGVSAYLPKKLYTESLVKDINTLVRDRGWQLDISQIKEQNWNELWEKQFNPVIVDSFCTIKASFHDILSKTQFTININPKMSFGTGHHETTYMMIEMMRHVEMKNKIVLDYGTGTAILAILASMLGAKSISAIDFDKNAIENAIENVKENEIDNIELEQAELKELNPIIKNHVVLANINYNVLLDNSQLLTEHIAQGGFLLLSGVLSSQAKNIHEKYENNGFHLVKQIQRGDWTCMKFTLQ